MAFSSKKPFFVFIPMMILAAVGVFVSLRLSNESKTVGSNISRAENTVTPPPVPSQNNPGEKITVHSPDGSLEVSMKVVPAAAGQKTYSFTVSDISGTNRKMIFTATVDQTQSMSIPANSWSPDNRYLFLEKNAGDISSFLVFKASGEAFSDGKTYIDAVSLFKDKNGLRVRDVTGWDSAELLHVFTAEENGNRGPAFWFDVNTKNFMQLANS